MGGVRSSTAPPPIERFIVFLAPSPSLAVDGDGRIYAAFHDARLAMRTCCCGRSSRGAPWNGPTRVNDTPQARRHRAVPAQARASPPTAGSTSSTTTAARTGANVRNEVSLQSSFDHGKTFTRSLRLTSKPFDSRIGFGAKEGLPDLGSRLALVSDDRSALGVWTDTRAGTPATQKQDLARPWSRSATRPGCRIPSESGLRYGGLAVGLAGIVLAGLGFSRMQRQPV